MLIDFFVIQKVGTPQRGFKLSFLAVCTCRGACRWGQITCMTCQATASLPRSLSDVEGERTEDSKNCSPFSATFSHRNPWRCDIYIYSHNVNKDASIRLLAPSRLQYFCCNSQKNSQDIASFFSFRKMNVNHSFIQQLQKTQQELYVVHETLEASEETSYEESIKAEGSFMTQLHAKFCAKVWFLFRLRSQSFPNICTPSRPSVVV